MAQPEQQDYFLVIEESDKDSVIHARGEGKDVLSSLARVSLALMGAEDDPGGIRAFGDYRSPDVYMATQRALAAFEDDPQDYARYPVDTKELSNLLHRSTGSLFDNRLHAHNNTLIERVKDGMRSPASVNEELMLQVHDLQLLESVSQRWFNREGWVLSAPLHRNTQESPAMDARQLYRVIKSQRLDPEVRENLFDAVPKRAKAYQGRRSPLNFHKTHGYLNERRPFLLGSGMVEDVYGYIASGSKDFVLVVTRQRPWRRAE